MGTIRNAFPCSKESYVRDLLSQCQQNLVKHSLRGNNLWCVFDTPEHGKFVALFLLSCYQGCWGHKVMDETMGPYQYDCPLNFLDLAPEPSTGCHLNHQDSGKSWRTYVRQYHEEKRKRSSFKLSVGNKIELSDKDFPGYGGVYLVTQLLGRKGYLLNGYLRLNCKQSKRVQVVN